MKGVGFRVFITTIAALLGVTITGDIVADSIIVGASAIISITDLVRTIRNNKKRLEEESSANVTEETAQDGQEQ